MDTTHIPMTEQSRVDRCNDRIKAADARAYPAVGDPDYLGLYELCLDYAVAAREAEAMAAHYITQAEMARDDLAAAIDPDDSRVCQEGEARISTEVVQAVAAYLATRPYQEVYQLIAAMEQTITVPD